MIDFINEYQSELLDTKKKILEKIKSLEISSVEKNKILEYLEVEENNHDRSFVPVNYEEIANKQKKEEIKGDLNLIFQEKRELENNLKIIDKKLSRINELLHSDSNKYHLDSIIYKIEFCKKLVDIDKERCKLELASILKDLNDMINR